jgi:hypothetical protein
VIPALVRCGSSAGFCDGLLCLNGNQLPYVIRKFSMDNQAARWAAIGGDGPAGCIGLPCVLEQEGNFLTT